MTLLCLHQNAQFALQIEHAQFALQIEAGIQGEVEAKERQQQQRQQQARLHSRHPSVRQRVGDTISLSGSRPGAILGWRTTPRTPLRRQQPTPSAYWFSGDGERVEGHYGAPASQAGGSSSAEHVSCRYGRKAPACQSKTRQHSSPPAHARAVHTSWMRTAYRLWHFACGCFRRCSSSGSGCKCWMCM